MKRIVALALLLALPFGLPSTARAEAPYQAYVYNEYDKSKAAPISYAPKAAYTGLETGAGSFSEPQDMVVSKDGSIFVADTGNNRIVKLDKSFHAVDVIEQLSWQGKETKLAEPTGLYLDDNGKLYIADKGHGRVLRADLTSKQVELVIEKPKDPLIAADFIFKPVKIAADNAGMIYVLSEGQFFGLMQFDASGGFSGYYGSNKVEVTPAVVLETFWKNLLSKEQRAAMTKLLPIEYSNVEIGSDNFVYTTTIVSKNSREEIKKLNPLGNNVLTGRSGAADFGDKEFAVKQGVKQDSSFVDLSVDAEGFIAGLDRTQGRVFEYDLEGNPIAVFGALGNQKGTFLLPSAVAYWNNELLVLDAGKRNITRFALTEYGALVRQATILYNQGLYDEAAGIWRQVARRSANNSIAYVGIAKALEKEGQLDEALRYYKLGADREGYSDSFGQIRMETVRNNMPVIMTVLALLIVLYYGFKFYKHWSKRKGRRLPRERKSGTINHQA